jgi:O-antigen ligase
MSVINRFNAKARLATKPICLVKVESERTNIVTTMILIAVVAGTTLATSQQGLAVQLAVVALVVSFVWLLLIAPALGRIYWGALFQFPASFAVVLVLIALSVELLLFNDSSRSLEALRDSPLNKNNLLRGVLLGLAGLLGFGRTLASYSSRLFLLRGPQAYFVLYSLIALASAAYATAPFVAAAKALEIVIVYLLIGIVAYRIRSVTPDLARRYFANLWNLVLAFVTIRLIVYWLAALASPGEAFIAHDSVLPYQLSGRSVYGAIHPNTLGQLAAVILVVSTNRLLQIRGDKVARYAFWSAVLLFALLTLTFAQARTSLVAVCVAVPVLFLLNRRLWFGAFLSFGGLLLSAFYSDSLWGYFRRGQDAEALTSLTGRLNFWEVGLRMFQEAPLLGHGFYTSIRLDLTERLAAAYQGYDFSNIDNTFLEVLINNGLVGFVPFVLGFLLLWGKILRRAGYSTVSRGAFDGAEMICLFIIISFRALLGPTLQVFHMNLIFLFALVTYAYLPGQESTGEGLSDQSPLPYGRAQPLSLPVPNSADA